MHLNKNMGALEGGEEDDVCLDEAVRRTAKDASVWPYFMRAPAPSSFFRTFFFFFFGFTDAH